MHPIERLRWIARADDESGQTIACEAAWTLGELGASEPPAVLTASRRLVERHPACGPLWWACAHLVASEDPFETGRRVAAELLSDDVAHRLVAALRVDVASSDVVAATLPAEALRSAFAIRGATRVHLIGGYRMLRSEIRAFSAVADEVTGFEVEDAAEALEHAVALVVEPHLASVDGLLLDPDAAAVVATANAAKVPVWALLTVGRVLPQHLASAALELADGEFDLVGAASFSLAVDSEGSGEVCDALARATCPSCPELVPPEARAGLR